MKKIYVSPVVHVHCLYNRGAIMLGISDTSASTSVEDIEQEDGTGDINEAKSSWGCQW